MAVMVTAEVPGQTQQGYDGMRAMLEGALRQARGLVLHTSHPIDGGWRVIEIWESSQDANDFFARAVHPNLPPGIKPRRTFQELHHLIRP
jgi:hypothetical protein